MASASARRASPRLREIVGLAPQLRRRLSGDGAPPFRLELFLQPDGVAGEFVVDEAFLGLGRSRAEECRSERGGAHQTSHHLWRSPTKGPRDRRAGPCHGFAGEPIALAGGHNGEPLAFSSVLCDSGADRNGGAVMRDSLDGRGVGVRLGGLDWGRRRRGAAGPQPARPNLPGPVRPGFRGREGGVRGIARGRAQGDPGRARLDRRLQRRRHGDFGKRTFDAIVAYQRRAELNPGGVLDAKGQVGLQAAAQRAREAVKFAVATDPKTGVRIGVPERLLTKRDVNPNGGTRWQSVDEKITLDTRAIPPGETDLAALYERNLAIQTPGRQVTYKVLRPDFFVIGGETPTGKFYIRYASGPAGLRGFSLGYDKTLKDFDRTVVAIANSFAPFPEAAPVVAAGPATPPRPASLIASGIAVAPRRVLTTAGVEGCPDLRVAQAKARVVKANKAKALLCLNGRRLGRRSLSPCRPARRREERIWSSSPSADRSQVSSRRPPRPSPGGSSRPCSRAQAAVRPSPNPARSSASSALCQRRRMVDRHGAAHGAIR